MQRVIEPRGTSGDVRLWRAGQETGRSVGGRPLDDGDHRGRDGRAVVMRADRRAVGGLVVTRGSRGRLVGLRAEEQALGAEARTGDEDREHDHGDRTHGLSISGVAAPKPGAAYVLRYRTMPRRTAHNTSSAVLCRSSFSITCARCVSTVAGLMWSISATSLFE